jgi:hypothetical protein
VFIYRFGGLNNLLGKQLPDDGNGPKHVGASEIKRRSLGALVGFINYLSL